MGELIKSYSLKLKLCCVEISRGVQKFKGLDRRPIHSCLGFRLGSEIGLVSASGKQFDTRADMTPKHLPNI